MSLDDLAKARTARAEARKREQQLDARIEKLVKRSKAVRASGGGSLPDLAARLSRVERRLLAIEKLVKGKK